MVGTWVREVPPESIHANPGPDVPFRPLAIAAITGYLAWWFEEGPGATNPSVEET